MQLKTAQGKHCRGVASQDNTKNVKDFVDDAGDVVQCYSLDNVWNK